MTVLSSKPPDAVIEMNAVTAGSMRAPDATVVEDVYWRVAAGDYWVLAGLHGSGKSDFLMLTGGLALALLAGAGLVTGMGSFLNILKVIKAVRIARILRLMRVVKLFRNIRYARSPLAQRHLAAEQYRENKQEQKQQDEFSARKANQDLPDAS